MNLLKLILAAFVIGQGPLHITHDPGGRVAVRAAQVALNGDRPVRILGYCASACTMWLAARDVCIARDATLQFHGPSFWGLPLPPDQFDYWSSVIASHYPGTLADWYMQTGRFGTFTIIGEDVIANGWARPCWLSFEGG